MSVALRPAAATSIEERQSSGFRVTLGVVLLVGFSLALFAAQIITGTSWQFAGLALLFHLLTGMTIRAIGGPTNLFGLSVAVLALQQVTVSMVAKVWFLSPADTPLHHPLDTMAMYCVGMLGLLVAAWTYQRLRVDRIRPLFPPVVDHRKLSVMAIVLTVLSLARFFLLARFGVYEGAGGGVFIGGWVGPIRQFTFLPVLAVACGTASVIIKSEGRRCVGFVNGLAIAAPIIAGIIVAMRSDTASALVTFLLTCLAFKFKFRPVHYAVMVLAGYLFQFILFPYALYARGEGGVRIGSFEDRIAKAFRVLGEVATNPGKYEQEVNEPSPFEGWYTTRLRYYGKPIPTLERYSILIVNDEIVRATYQHGPAGWTTINAGWDMVLPRILNPDKEAFGTANWIAHRGEGIVGATDFYTQITMGFMVDGFQAFLWPGVFFCSFFVGLAYFVCYRLLMRPELYRNVYAVALAFLVTWVFSEGTIQAQILQCFQFTVYFIVIVFPVVIFARSFITKTKEAPNVFERRLKTE
jgi:hypothetical protein